MTKAEILLDWFKDKVSVAVAFSGGVDSTVVAKAAFTVLGKNAIAVTARSSTISEKELDGAKRVAGEIGIEHVIIDEDEMDDPRFVKNPENRCYYCRQGLVKAIRRLSGGRGIKHVIDGANADDPGEHRPGLLALREGGALSPLMELGIGKSDVRTIAAVWGLSVSDKPSMACLASRIPYGELITKEKLVMVELAEDFLRNLGFDQLRVRNHGGIARIEIESGEFDNVLKNRKKIAKKLKELGFDYVTLDLQGYRSGSMDEVL